MTALAFAIAFLAGAGATASLFFKSSGKRARRALFSLPPLLLPLLALCAFAGMKAFPSPSPLADALVIFSLLCLLFAGVRASRSLLRPKPRRKARAATKKEAKKMAEKYSIPRSFSSPNFFGFLEEEAPRAGKPDPALSFAASYPYWRLAKEGRIVGEPGAGLSSAPFSPALSMAGARGEKLLAKFFALACPGVKVYASLYGLKGGKKTPSDIDLVLAGVDREGRVRLWMVDAKNYRGGEGVVYDQISPETLIRVDARKRAFLAGAGGGAALKMSGNMGMQRAEWKRELSRASAGRWEVLDSWRVCIASCGSVAQPKVAPGVSWPGEVKVRTPFGICREVEKAGPLSPSLPSPLHSFLSSMLKP